MNRLYNLPARQYLISMEKHTTGKIDRTGYCYCPECNSIRYIRELKKADTEYTCGVCGSGGLVSPGWIQCPQIGYTSVNCPVGGMGIVTEDARTYCNLYCSFRS